LHGEDSKPTDFELLNKHRDFHEETFVGYGYRSKLDYQTVKRFYLDYFAQNGWVLAEDKNDGWGDPKKYARLFRDAEYDGRLQHYSAEDIQKIREAQGIGQPPPVPVLASWRSVTASRPLDKMGHAKKHLGDFQKIDPTLTNDDVAKILEHVRKVGQSSPTKFGGKAFEAAVDIGGKSVTVKVIESSGGLIKTGYPIP